MSSQYTTEELIICCISHRIQNGFIVVEGINTTLPTAGYRLARLTHAPQATFVSLAGNVYVDKPLSLSLALEEEMAVGHAVGFQSSAVPPLYTTYKHDFEMLRSAQIDQYGNANSTVIGDLSKPKVRLPGISGVLDVFALDEHVFMYFPRHTRRIFVRKVDFVSALGYGDGSSDARSGLLGVGPSEIITNLGVFGFEEKTRRMRLHSIHPGIDVQEIINSTDFPVLMEKGPPLTPAPSSKELEFIRNVIDPLGLRDIESESGPERLALLRKILEREKQMHESNQWKPLMTESKG